MRRASAILGSVALAVGVAAGCGSSKSPAPSKAEFLTKANVACVRANQKLATAGQTFFKSQAGKQRTEADFVQTKVAPIINHDLLAPIHALGAPKGDEDEVGAILDAGRAAVLQLKKDPMLIRAPQGSTRDPFRTLTRLTKAYGLTCGGSG